MNRKFKDFLFYKKNGYLVINNLISIKEISKINNLVIKILIKEKIKACNNYTFANKGPLHFYVSTPKKYII